MDNPPPAAEPTESPASTKCGCGPARCPHCGAGWRTEVVARHMHNLAVIGDIGMELAGQIRRQVRREGKVTPQTTKMFEQITRAVRRAHALEAKFDADGRKTEAQWATEWARAEAATQRASQPGRPEQPAAAPAQAAEPRKRDNPLDDLRDRDDTMADLEDLEDFGDLEDFDEREDRREDAEEAALDEDDDEGDGASLSAKGLDSLGKSVAMLRQRLAAAKQRARAQQAAEGRRVAPDASGNGAAPRTQAALVAATICPQAPALVSPIPAALAWPPPAAPAHGPPR